MVAGQIPDGFDHDVRAGGEKLTLPAFWACRYTVSQASGAGQASDDDRAPQCLDGAPKCPPYRAIDRHPTLDQADDTFSDHPDDEAQASQRVVRILVIAIGTRYLWSTWLTTAPSVTAVSGGLRGPCHDLPMSRFETCDGTVSDP